MNTDERPDEAGDRAKPRALASLLQTQRGPTPWRQAVQIVAAVVRALDRDGPPLNPDELTVRPAPQPSAPDRVAIGRDAEAAPGGTGRATGATLDPRWLPPEQADGAPWSAAADRYVVGLLLYRLLSGEHAFATRGRGLRLAMQEARRGAPPMPEAVTRGLPPGLQGYCLRLLDAELGQRPRTHHEVVERLEEFLGEREAQVKATPSSPGIAEQPATQEWVQAPTRRAGGRRWLAPALAVGLGAAAAYAILGAPPPKPAIATPERVAEVPAKPPLTTQTTSAEDCAECHPRQASEWQRSVMGQSGHSPLFQALEILIEEQVGRSDRCVHGAGILRKGDPATGCRDDNSGLLITGSGGEHWCVNCHTPLENLSARMPAWDGFSANARSRLPIRDLLSPKEMAGIDCAFCHQVHGPVQPGNEARGRYEGNPFWTSTQTGERFSMRPEDARGVGGIANSGYLLDDGTLLLPRADGALAGFDEVDAVDEVERVAGDAHRRPGAQTRSYLRSSQFCGACHDVRIFGSDALGIARGERFKRLRNAYSEWVDWGAEEARAGRAPASCQDCHMSLYPGVCVPGDGPLAAGSGASALLRACPPGTKFEARAPGSYPEAAVATSSAGPASVTSHYFSGVDVPLSRAFADALIHEPTVDTTGTPLGAHQRRDLLLGASFRFEITGPRRVGDTLEIPIELENVGAGHRIPAGFSQEREFWVHLRVTDGRGELVYEVGRVERGDDDLRDKVFLQVNTSDALRDAQGQPLGVFGADVTDGPDVPQWDPPVEEGGTTFRGRGLINLQNGFLRCVRCIGFIDARGECQPLAGQERTRAGRFDDGKFDADTGVCESNLFGEAALFEVYFPIASLDATRGAVRGPDAIIDRRSAAPKVPQRYTYELNAAGREGPFTVEARLMFRAFPPFLLRAFIDYERRKAAEGLRPSGPLISEEALARLEAVELHRARAEVR
ncbi:MAG: hypothetical protein H6713_11700 [Myxococcales bacterium]|nr:hypothetical protein [Myxococcales bacterium]